MNEFEDMLSGALSDRARGVTATSGSVMDARRLARRRSRRRAVAAAGAVTAVGAAGAVVVLAAGGSDDGMTLSAGSGDSILAQSDAGEVWLCRGPLGVMRGEGVASTTGVPTTVSMIGTSTTLVDATTTSTSVEQLPSTTVEFPDSTVTSIVGAAPTTVLLESRQTSIVDPSPATVLSDGQFYFQHCEMVGAPTDVTRTVQTPSVGGESSVVVGTALPDGIAPEQG
jgi:hypothetical protein